MDNITVYLPDIKTVFEGHAEILEQSDVISPNVFRVIAIGTTQVELAKRSLGNPSKTGIDGVVYQTGVKAIEMVGNQAI
jgi:hypothetical protein